MINTCELIRTYLLMRACALAYNSMNRVRDKNSKYHRMDDGRLDCFRYYKIHRHSTLI